LVGKFLPPDAELVNVSRTVGGDRLVEEMVLKFTHTEPVDWMLPGVRPTGKRVEIAGVVIVEFEEGKIAHEHQAISKTPGTAYPNTHENDRAC
jgi:carboxymethylenebutenolidase